MAIPDNNGEGGTRAALSPLYIGASRVPPPVCHRVPPPVCHLSGSSRDGGPEPAILQCRARQSLVAIRWRRDHGTRALQLAFRPCTGEAVITKRRA